ncbi:MAG: hypothetical protein WBL61_12960, partial [Bryobacteraceae bacterium]
RWLCKLLFDGKLSGDHIRSPTPSIAAKECGNGSCGSDAATCLIPRRPSVCAAAEQIYTATTIEDDQRNYWNWRHEHSDALLKIEIKIELIRSLGAPDRL